MGFQQIGENFTFYTEPIMLYSPKYDEVPRGFGSSVATIWDGGLSPLLFVGEPGAECTVGWGPLPAPSWLPSLPFRVVHAM